MYQTQAKYLKMWAEPTRKLKHYEMKKYTAHGFHKCNPKGLKNTLITRFIISGEGVWGLWRNSCNSSLCLCLRCWVLSVEAAQRVIIEWQGQLQLNTRGAASMSGPSLLLILLLSVNLNINSNRAHDCDLEHDHQVGEGRRGWNY